MFRDLSQTEEQEFQQWAKDNFDPSKDVINPVWHPVVQQACEEMLLELKGDEATLTRKE